MEPGATRTERAEPRRLVVTCPPKSRRVAWLRFSRSLPSWWSIDGPGLYSHLMFLLRILHFIIPSWAVLKSIQSGAPVAVTRLPERSTGGASS